MSPSASGTGITVWALAFALDAMHDAPRSRIERIAMMHDAPVVPDEDVAAPPGVMPRDLGARRMRP
jgi:hypothetical protein